MRTINILVVDDASFIRDLIKKCLRASFPGLEIAEAANGKKAQQLLAAQRYDLVLCDWEMPEMSGLELLVWFRAQDVYTRTPFVMVTSRGDKENVIQAIQAGVSDYVGKPFTSEQLVGKVRKVLTAAGALTQSTASAPAAPQAQVSDSVAALTGTRPAAQPARPTAAAHPRQVAAASNPLLSARAPASAPSKGPDAGARGTALLRMAAGEQACLVKAISLKEAVLLLKRGETAPAILESVVLNLEQGDSTPEVAHLNAYVHALSAVEQGGSIQWVQLHCRFVDKDPQKLDYISRLIARGTTQNHFTPGA